MKRHLIIGDGLSSWASELVDAAPRGQVAYLGADATCHLTYLRDTVIEEVAFGLEQRGTHPDIMLDRVTAILTDLNLMDLAEAHPTRLSGGQTRRVALASVLVLQADTLVLDDPWAGLDTASCKQVCDILDRYPGDIIAVAHSLPPIDHHFDCFELRDGTMVPYTGQHLSPQLPPCVPTGDIIDLGDVAGKREPPRRRWWQFTTPTEPGFTTPPLHLRLERGEICWLRGPNGVGKTTLLHTLALTPQPASISMQTQRACDQVTETTLRDFIGGEPARALASIDPETHPLDLTPTMLRLAQVEKVFNQGTDVVLLDEPDVGLDYPGRTQLHRLIHRHLRRNRPPAIIMTCHDPTLMAEVSQYATVRELALA